METISDLGKYTFPALMANSVKKFGDRPALTLVGGNPITYAQFAEKSLSVAKMLKGLGLKEGAKIAVYGTGCPAWGVAYIGIVSYGMVAVPLLPDFSAMEVSSILEHCQVNAIFVESKLYAKIEGLKDKLPETIIKLDDYSVIKSINDEFTGKKIEDFSEVEAPVSKTEEEDTASIIYTSGTTGRSKGVELTHKNLVWTSVQCQTVHRVNKMDRTLSFLPLSHVYEFTISFVLQILNGACIYYLGKPPVVSALLSAFKIVQPTIVLAVPLIMEKIYKNQVLPKFTKTSLTRFLYKMRFTHMILNRIAGRTLKKTFGGHIIFFGIGGSKIDPVVEKFMKSAKFPYAIGYGLTETSPLLAGSGVKITVPGTIGPIMDGVDLQIANPDPVTGVGEVVAKGENVMKGYYKDPELTKSVFTTEDDSCGAGYFKTGDLGVLIKKRRRMYLALKGRCKNMILGPSGENIYPEDIEFVINQNPVVSESLVVEDDNGLVALVAVDEDKLLKEAEERAKENQPQTFIEMIKSIPGTVTEGFKKLPENITVSFQKQFAEFTRDVAYQKEKIISEIQFYVNSKVNKSSKINKVQQVDEFEKTATQKIKRFKYDMRTKKDK